MKPFAVFLLALWLWLCGVQADQTIFQPTTYVFPANLTIQTGVPLLGTWDFTGATVIGITGGGGGTGNVVGPSSATDNAIPRYDGTTGKTLQNSGITIPDGTVGVLSGTNTGDQTFTLTGPVTGSGSVSIPTTIAPGVVTLANMANMATGSLIYRKTAGTGPPEVNPLATLKTDLGLSGTNTGDQTNVTGNAGTATRLQTPRNINGVAFDGTANINIGVAVGGVTGLGTNVPALLASNSVAVAWSEYALLANLHTLAFLDSVAFSAVTGLLAPNQIDRTVDVVTQAATVSVPADDPKKTVETGTLATLAFTGGSGPTKEWRVYVDVTVGKTIAFTDGTNPITVRRIGTTQGLTSAFFPKGYHEIVLHFIGTEWVMSDTFNSTDPVVWVALSDETTQLTTGTKLICRSPYAFTVTGVRASLTTASSIGLPTVDILQNGVSIFSTKLTVDATEKTSATAAAPAVVSFTSIPDDAELTFNVDGAGTGATGLKVCVFGYR